MKDVENYIAIKDESDKPEFIKSLTYKQRGIGFVICVLLGIVLSFISFFILFFSDKENKIVAFALFYTLGNLLSIFSTCFFIGFKRQWKNMINKKRRYTSLVFISSIFLTLIIAFFIEHKIKRVLMLFLIIIQYCAFFWYSLSYIPFARKIFKKCCKFLVIE